MDDWNEAEDPYKILELDKGSEVTEAEIRKAYRKLALTKHPDKQRDNPNAAAEFNAIQRAYEKVLDPGFRDAWNQLAKAKKARQERQAGDTAKRRKMTEDLERREKAFATDRNEEHAARARLKAELERLKRQHAEREAQKQAEKVAAGAAASFTGRGVPAQSPQPSQGPPQMSPELMRTLKVTWDARQGQYTADDLRRIFGAHGEVSDVIMRQPGKKKSKGSAFVEMGTMEAAASAARAQNGSPDAPLLVVPFNKVATVEDGVTPEAVQNGKSAAPSVSGAPLSPTFTSGKPGQPLFPVGRLQQTPGASTFPSFPPSTPQVGTGVSGSNGRPPAFGSFKASSFPSGGGPAFGSASRDFESETLRKMKQKAERDRLIAEEKARDEAEQERS